MIKQILLLVGVIFLVTGCNKDLQRSANNKLFDTKGFDQSKRKPIYNDKYIDRAKRNIVENNYEDEEIELDEPDEYADPYTQNRIMYSNMIKKDKSKKRKGGSNSEPYPNIGHARDLAALENKSDSNSDLRKELDEIKTMLSSAKKDLSKYKCPIQNVDHVEAPHPKKQVVKKVAPAKPLVTQIEEEETYDEISDEIDIKADQISEDHATIAESAPHHPTQSREEHNPSASTHNAVSEPAAPTPARVPVIAPARVPVQAQPALSPTTVAPATPKTSTIRAQQSAAALERRESHNPMSVIPATQGSEHSMINLAPAK